MTANDIGLRIGEYIKERGYNQAEVARKNGMTPVSFNRIINGYRKIDCVTYFKICKFLELPLEYFFEKAND